ncbi:MAG: TonB-dependent receptor [Rhodothermales bacterium]
MRGLLASALLLLAVAFPSFAQPSDTTRVTLSEVQVEAARGAFDVQASPYAVTVQARATETLNSRTDASLTAALRQLPGVWMGDRGHFAIGERLSVRGMGWRANFGVRGVQVLLDGIPLTMPDGQAILDLADPSLIRSAELIRGPSALFWGNGSGGVLALTTLSASPPTLRLRAMRGSFGQQHLLAEAGTQFGPSRLHGYVSDLRQDGYRAYSSGRFTRAGARWSTSITPHTLLRLTAAFADQDAENPGAINQAQLDADRRSARDLNVTRQAAKYSQQIQGALQAEHRLPGGMLSGTVWMLSRDLDNPLTFTYVDLNRLAYGTRLSGQGTTNRWRWGVGLDAARMDDDRLNLPNNNGTAGEVPTLDQQETVTNIAASGFATYRLSNALALNAGLRYDAIRFELSDKLFDNGDQSGNRSFNALSPGLGVSVQPNTVTYYANVRTAFETPTTTELVNRPDNQSGFNPNLNPSRILGGEIGARGSVANLFLDVALYAADVSDRLQPAEAADGRTYYQNSGGTVHQGLEIAVYWAPTPHLTLEGTGSTNRYRFDELDATLPGLPASQASFALTYDAPFGLARLSTQHVPDYYVNDANTIESPGYTLLDMDLSLTTLTFGSVHLQPTVRLGNLLDATYNGAVIINGFGGRFFEPAPGRTIQVALTLTLP